MTTKNIYIHEQAFGFAIYNDGKVVDYATSCYEAEEKAKQISDTKGIILKGLVNMTLRKAKKEA